MVLPYSSLVNNPDLFGDGYHVRVAKEIWKRSHKYQLECWRPERKLKQEISGEKDGLTYRAFPSWRPSLGKLTSFVYKKVVDTYAPLRWSLWREYSFPLLRALRKECSKGDTIIYLHHLHFDLSYLICLLCGDVPIIGHHIGGTPFAYSLSSFIGELPFSLLEQKALANVDAAFITTVSYYHSFKKFYKNISKVVYPMPQCVDFDLFKPMDKAEARRLVGIDPNKKVLIHVGRFDYAKGFDAILEVLPALRERYDIEFIAIGGTKQDMLYQRAIDSGVRVLEWMPQEELVKYYNASDVYLLPKFYNGHSGADPDRFMATGVASEEALACGIPVIGTNLNNFFEPGELRGMGLIPKDKEDLVECISRVFEHQGDYSRCREIAMKYYSWQPRVEKMLEVFDELSEEYCGVKA